MISKRILAFSTVGAGFHFSNRFLSSREQTFRTIYSSCDTTNLADLRKEYSQKGLLEQQISDDPIALFKEWIIEAQKSKVIEPNAMCLSTCQNNLPSARFVLLKELDDRGFVWFTNYESRKGQELTENPNAALTFWWGDLERQVRVEGRVERLTAQESDEYFQIRPRGSRIGAWASHQSQPISSREALEEQESEIKDRFPGQSFVPRPDHWGGFRLVPNKIEFWKGRRGRLHDRILFTLKSEEEIEEEVETLVLGNGDAKETGSKSIQWKRARLQP